MGRLHVPLTSRLSIKGSPRENFLKMGSQNKKFEKPWFIQPSWSVFCTLLEPTVRHMFSDFCFSNKNQTIGFTPCIENSTSTVYSAFYCVSDAFTNSLIRDNENIFYLLVAIIFSGAFSTLVKAYDWLKFYLAFFNTRIQIDTCGHRRGLPGSFPAGNR